MKKSAKIALGGGCHWCTEAIFDSLKGVSEVKQGFVASLGQESSFSEAIIIHFDPRLISLETLIEIHLCTHKSTSDHSMRLKYRSAIYTFSNDQFNKTKKILTLLQSGFEKPLVTKVYPFKRFEPSKPQFENYYSRHPNSPFCEKYIHPKLEILRQNFSGYVKRRKIESLSTTA